MNNLVSLEKTILVNFLITAALSILSKACDNFRCTKLYNKDKQRKKGLLFDFGLEVKTFSPILPYGAYTAILPFLRFSEDCDLTYIM